MHCSKLFYRSGRQVLETAAVQQPVLAAGQFCNKYGVQLWVHQAKGLAARKVRGIRVYAALFITGETQHQADPANHTYQLSGTITRIEDKDGVDITDVIPHDQRVLEPWRLTLHKTGQRDIAAYPFSERVEDKQFWIAATGVIAGDWSKIAPFHLAGQLKGAKRLLIKHVQATGEAVLLTHWEK